MRCPALRANPSTETRNLLELVFAIDVNLTDDEKITSCTYLTCLFPYNI